MLMSYFHHAGYQWDEETKLYYLNARYYDSKIARFLSEDTYAGDPNDPLTLNLYAYCYNDPIMYTDPTGHWGGTDGKSNDSTLNSGAQARIIALTNSWFAATTNEERKAIADKANEVRKNAASYADSSITISNTSSFNQPLQAGLSRGSITKSEWNNACFLKIFQLLLCHRHLGSALNLASSFQQVL